MHGTNDVLEFEGVENVRWYHDGLGTNFSQKTRRTKGSQVPLDERPFIAWDGESGSGHEMVQDYHLFACVTPTGPRHIKARDGLQTRQLLQFIVDIEEEFPDAVHVGFGFGYDVNQIIGSLNKYQLETIHKTGILYFDNRRWRLEWRKHKSLTITRQYTKTHRTSVVIYDVFSFFVCSFVKALEKFDTSPPDVLAQIKEGKARRGTFTYEEIDDYVLPYCIAECEQLVNLMNHFRDLTYGVGFKIRHWHGPGAVASFVLRSYGVKHAMKPPSDEVRLASQYAYAAGRFELMKVGHTGPLWSVDINSAYPYAISQLPNLQMGRWVHVDNPTRIARFGVYRVTGGPGFRSIGTSRPAPLWHRDQTGRISFPWQIDGWYWSPEAALVISAPYYKVSEGWEFVPDPGCTRPFQFVEGMYKKRQEWKSAGNPAEYALKLAMNSLYGKMAQRVGWDQKNMKPPPWHQLEWAGWVTSFCRARIYRLGSEIGWKNVVAIETDGIYTTRNPMEVGISPSKALGELSVEYYSDCVYVQSGLAWLHAPHELETDTVRGHCGGCSISDRWVQKYRGLDPESLPLSKMVEHLSHVDWGQKIEATTTRFIGIGAALMSRDYLTRWRVWETIPRLIAVGGDGKRIHAQKICRACAAGKMPYDTMHDLIINLPKPGMSNPHYLPWVPDVGRDPPWREGAEEISELLLAV